MNILLDKLDFDEDWAYNTFKNIIRPDLKICVIPFAFHEDWIQNHKEWEKCYNKIDGEQYKIIAAPFYTYGISDDNITLINYFADISDSAKSKINSSDMIFFTGGFPDKIMSRLEELDLINTTQQFSGIKMGWSAGAVMQCYEYFLSPDEDYPEFVYLKGLKYIEDFAVEVHYKNTKVQNESIEKYMREKGKRAYTTEPHSAIIVDGSEVSLLGNARLYK